MLIEALVRSAVLLLAGVAAASLLRQRSAAMRHCVLAGSIAAAALAAPLGRAVPGMPILSMPATAQAVTPISDRHSSPPVSTAEDAGHIPTPPTAGGSGVDPLVVIWAAGFALGLLSLLLQLARVQRTSARATPLVDGPWVDAVEDARRRCGMRRPITVLQTDAPDLLATWGVRRPRILLPPGAPGWQAERIQVVVLHELAHIRRHDWIVQLAASFVSRVYWFQPLMWVAARRLRRESEHACDDIVINSGIAIRSYARQLLELAAADRSRRTWASAVSMARRSTLERRITAMLDASLNHRALSVRTFAGVAAILVAATLTAAALQPAQVQPQPLAGTFYDTGGGVMPGLTVTLTDAGGGGMETTTDAAGRFQFSTLPAGKYVLTAAVPGFNDLRTEFELRRAGDWDRAITMQVGQLRETIAVSETRLPATRAVPTGPTPVRVGGNIKAPQKLVDVKPTYPISMRQEGRSGVVSLDAVIGEDGSVQSARVVGSDAHPAFGEAAMQAVRQWKFSPTLLNGKPVDVLMNVRVSFTLE